MSIMGARNQARQQAQSLAAELEALRRDCTICRDKLRQCGQAYRNVQAENVELRRRVDAAESITTATQKMMDRLMAQTEMFAKELSRSPEVISESILTGLGNIMNGYAQQAAESRDEAVQQMSMQTLGLDNDAGVPHGAFFPDVEFDEWTGPMPTPGMMTSSPVSPGDQYSPVHGVTDNGQVARMDGQPMFQAGTSGPRPVGGIET